MSVSTSTVSLPPKPERESKFKWFVIAETKPTWQKEKKKGRDASRGFGFFLPSAIKSYSTIDEYVDALLQKYRFNEKFFLEKDKADAKFRAHHTTTDAVHVFPAKGPADFEDPGSMYDKEVLPAVIKYFYGRGGEPARFRSASAMASFPESPVVSPKKAEKRKERESTPPPAEAEGEEEGEEKKVAEKEKLPTAAKKRAKKTPEKSLLSLPAEEEEAQEVPPKEVPKLAVAATATAAVLPPKEPKVAAATATAAVPPPKEVFQAAAVPKAAAVSPPKEATKVAATAVAPPKEVTKVAATVSVAPPKEAVKVAAIAATAVSVPPAKEAQKAVASSSTAAVSSAPPKQKLRLKSSAPAAALSKASEAVPFKLLLSNKEVASKEEILAAVQRDGLFQVKVVPDGVEARPFAVSASTEIAVSSTAAPPVFDALRGYVTVRLFPRSHVVPPPQSLSAALLKGAVEYEVFDGWTLFMHPWLRRSAIPVSLVTAATAAAAATSTTFGTTATTSATATTVTTAVPERLEEAESATAWLITPLPFEQLGTVVPDLQRLSQMGRVVMFYHQAKQVLDRILENLVAVQFGSQNYVHYSDQMWPRGRLQNNTPFIAAQQRAGSTTKHVWGVFGPPEFPWVDEASLNSNVPPFSATEALSRARARFNLVPVPEFWDADSQAERRSALRRLLLQHSGQEGNVKFSVSPFTGIYSFYGAQPDSASALTAETNAEQWQLQAHRFPSALAPTSSSTASTAMLPAISFATVEGFVLPPRNLSASDERFRLRVRNVSLPWGYAVPTSLGVLYRWLEKWRLADAARLLVAVAILYPTTRDDALRYLERPSDFEQAFAAVGPVDDAKWTEFGNLERAKMAELDRLEAERKEKERRDRERKEKERKAEERKEQERQQQELWQKAQQQFRREQQRKEDRDRIEKEAQERRAKEKKERDDRERKEKAERDERERKEKAEQDERERKEKAERQKEIDRLREEKRQQRLREAQEEPLVVDPSQRHREVEILSQRDTAFPTASSMPPMPLSPLTLSPHRTPATAAATTATTATTVATAATTAATTPATMAPVTMATTAATTTTTTSTTAATTTAATTATTTATTAATATTASRQKTVYDADIDIYTQVDYGDEDEPEESAPVSLPLPLGEDTQEVVVEMLSEDFGESVPPEHDEEEQRKERRRLEKALELFRKKE